MPDQAVDVLACDQWAGARALPELLAAFSLPNDPAVDRLIFRAAQLLAKAGRGRSMNGHESKNREDVWAQKQAPSRIEDGPAILNYTGPRIPVARMHGGVAMKKAGKRARR